MFEPVTMTRSTSAVAPAPTCSGGGEAIAPGTRSCPETFPAMNRAKAMATRCLLIAFPILIVSCSLGPRQCGQLNRAEASQIYLNRTFGIIILVVSVVSYFRSHSRQDHRG